MSIKDWHISFKVQLDSLDTESALRLQPEVVDIFLNKAVNKVILDLYKQYEETQEISDNLSSQTVPTECTFSLLEEGQYKVSLPEDYYYYLQSSARLKINSTEGNVITIKQTLDRESKIINSVFKGPNDAEIPIFFKNNYIHVYTGEGELVKFNLTYLKKPIKVSYKENISSDISEALHERVINLAVIMALENYSSERTASKVQIKDVT
jgi:hypothetical protein